MSNTAKIVSLTLLSILTTRVDAFSLRETSCKKCLHPQIIYSKPLVRSPLQRSTFNLKMSSQSENEEQKVQENPLTLKSVVTSTISIIGIISSLVLLWSEESIAFTRCGPVELSDSLERSSYIATFILASGSNLSRIIYGSPLTDLLIEEEDGISKTFFSVGEILSVTAVLGAFGGCAWQVFTGDAFAEGAGLSGIDVRWCRLMNEG